MVTNIRLHKFFKTYLVPRWGGKGSPNSDDGQGETEHIKMRFGSHYITTDSTVKK